MANILGLIKKPSEGLVKKFLTEIAGHDIEVIASKYFTHDFTQVLKKNAERFLSKGPVIDDLKFPKLKVTLSRHKDGYHPPVLGISGIYQDLSAFGSGDFGRAAIRGLETTRLEVQKYSTQAKDMYPHTFHATFFMLNETQAKAVERAVGVKFRSIKPGQSMHIEDKVRLQQFDQLKMLPDLQSQAVIRSVSLVDMGVMVGKDVEKGLPLQQLPEMTFPNLYGLEQNIQTGHIIRPLDFKYRGKTYQFEYNMGMPLEPGGAASRRISIDPDIPAIGFGRYIFDIVPNSYPMGHIHFGGASAVNSHTAYFARNNGYHGKYLSSVFGYYQGVANGLTTYYERVLDELAFLAMYRSHGRAFGHGLNIKYTHLDPSTLKGYQELILRADYTYSRALSEPEGKILGDPNGFRLFGDDLSKWISPALGLGLVALTQKEVA